MLSTYGLLLERSGRLASQLQRTLPEVEVMRSICIGLLAASAMFAKEVPADKRLEEATAVLTEIMSTPDKGIPQNLLEKAHDIAIVPVLMKGAFIVGAKNGRWLISF